MISRELETEILRLYHAEGWRIGTLARQLHVHRETVRRVLSQAGITVAPQYARPSMLDPFVAFIQETFTRFPTLRASRLYQMLRARGYTGGPDHFRHSVARYRPRPSAEAYLRLRTLQGEQGQVDWAHFGKIDIGRARRPLMAFVMVLSYSRHLFLRFYLNAAMGSFLHGHVAAFTFFNAVPRTVCCTTIYAAPCSSASGMRSASKRRSWSSPLGITSNRGPWPWRAATRRAGSSGRSALCASASLRPAVLPIWPI